MFCHPIVFNGWIELIFAADNAKLLAQIEQLIHHLIKIVALISSQ
jgi:hypothetical protein